jgi:hypothetical protein
VTLTSQSTTLLAYAMTTSPNPLEVSTSPTSPAIGDLTFVVSCPRSVGECTVGQIAIILPVGAISDATNLTGTAPPLSAASISSSDGVQWVPSAGVAAGEFIFTPPNGSVAVTSQSLTITINGIEISPLVGTSNIQILEWASPGTFAPPPSRGAPSGTATIQTSKFPQGFYAFDFNPQTPQVNSGETVTLTWVGSSNADFSIAYADQPAVPVTGRTWTSPPLYTTTVFVLEASATVAGQTVTLDLQATVIVATPQITEFTANPDQIDYNEQVTLEWRAVNADGVYLLTGQTGRQTLGVASDPSTPVYLTPEYGGSYSLQAFKNEAQGQIVSPPVPLGFTFNPIDIVSFSANPTTVDLQNQTTTLSWQVEHAKSVAYQGGTVAATGNSVESPKSNATYNLVATWVDGSTVTAPPVSVEVLNVQVDGWAPQFTEVSGTEVSIALGLTAANATGATISNAHMLFCNRHHWYIWGTNWTSATLPAATMQAVDATHWTTTLDFQNLNPVAMGWGNIGLCFDYTVDGYVPQSAQNVIVMWKGSFTFWNGS